MHSPIVAMLWEQWRLSRVEAAQRFGLGLLAGSAALVLGQGVPAAFVILVCVHAFFWFSIAKLNGGRFMDGYKPGFPLYLLFTRPVPTTTLVGVTMGYDAASCLALYIISAAVLSLVFGQPLPLFSTALFLVTIHFAFICIQWSTRSRTAQWTGSLAATAPLFLVIKDRATSPMPIEFSLAENALMVLVCIVSFGLTVAGVARQRRGDTEEKASNVEGFGGYPAWMISFFRFRCPTSSATKAQLWFELKSSGLPILAIGLTSSLVIFLLFAIGIPLALIRDAAVGIPLAVFGFVLFGLGGNAFGIRKRQGRMFVSAFEATQPYDIALLAGVKILVRAGCLLIALSAIAVTLWASSSLLNVWSPWPYLVEGGKDAVPDLLELRQAIGAGLSQLTGYSLAALAILTAVSVTVLVASLAVFTALRARYRRRVLTGVSLLLLCGIALVLIAWGVNRGILPSYLEDTIPRALAWIAGAALVTATVYLLWKSFSERLLTTGYALGAFVFVALWGVAWMTAVLSTGGRLVAPMLWLVLLPLTPSLLAPWSLSRVRTA